MLLDTTLLDTISRLALEIAREAPDCADKAMRIESMARDLAAAAPDRGAIEDALASSDEGGLSDVSEHRTAEAVARAVGSGRA